jgi:RNA-directed DNA polymerase
LLANVSLQDVLDLWGQWWRRHHAHVDVIIVRWADEVIVGFEYAEDAQRFLTKLRKRFAGSGWNCIPTRPGGSNCGASP